MEKRPVAPLMAGVGEKAMVEPDYPCTNWQDHGA